MQHLDILISLTTGGEQINYLPKMALSASHFCPLCPAASQKSVELVQLELSVPHLFRRSADDTPHQYTWWIMRWSRWVFQGHVKGLLLNDGSVKTTIHLSIFEIMESRIKWISGALSLARGHHQKKCSSMVGNKAGIA